MNEDKAKYDREPENVPEDFYVATDECLICCAPLEVAPDLMGFHKDTKGNGGSHCYFKKQPQTLEEVKQAIEAVSVSCCGAVRYCGVNPDILKAIR